MLPAFEARCAELRARVTEARKPGATLRVRGVVPYAERLERRMHRQHKIRRSSLYWKECERLKAELACVGLSPVPLMMFDLIEWRER